MNPRKPNSAKRKIAKVQIMGQVTEKEDGLRAFAKIPGEGKHGLNEFNVVLLEGKGPNDTPGVNYSLIRGVEDFLYLEEDRRQKRSKYGIKRPRSEIAIKKQKRVRGRFIKEGPVKFY